MNPTRVNWLTTEERGKEDEDGLYDSELWNRNLARMELRTQE